MEEIIINKINWKNSVPIFKSSIILKQLFIAVGIPFGLVLIFILLSSGTNRYSLYAIGFIFATFLLTYIFIKLVFGGKYEAEFTVDEQGIKCCSQEKQVRKSRIINNITVLAGFLSQKPAVVGAGILANTKTNIFIPWDKITKAIYSDKQYVIIVKGSLTENIALFCTEDNYNEVKNIVRGKVNV